MKRVRTEQIQYAVSQYLKRRQYVDTDGALKGAKLFQSAEEMAASLTGEPHTVQLARLPTVRMYVRSAHTCLPVSARLSSADRVGLCQHRHGGTLPV